ncbi:hypothetical protein BpHYR1_012967 [Brachionus plicatilis]|uniref:Uncharacterized protein n=1 Tax=Brachionus plicatilis TaxID=10195 RepID=A0A3M7RCJ3_BRAPC|nr:hypothetical protein BpHYR1_012967 [Brachionus plicatilis]
MASMVLVPYRINPNFDIVPRHSKLNLKKRNLNNKFEIILLEKNVDFSCCETFVDTLASSFILAFISSSIDILNAIKTFKIKVLIEA